MKNGEPIVRFEGEKLETLLSIRRDQLFLERLGVVKSALQAAAASPAVGPAQ